MGVGGGWRRVRAGEGVGWKVFRGHARGGFVRVIAQWVVNMAHEAKPHLPGAVLMMAACFFALPICANWKNQNSRFSLA